MTSKRTQLIAAPFTPLNRDGSLALSQIDRHYEFLKNQGAVDGVFICGTTGEGVSLTSEERRQVAERWMTATGGNFPVMVHVGHTSVEDSRQLAAHAAELGAYAVATMAPFYFKPQTVKDLVDCCAIIAAACPKLRFYYYHIPVLTGVNISMPAFVREATARIPNFAGVKYTDANLMDFALCREESAPGQEVFFGWDEIMLAGLSFGSDGFVGSTYSYVAPLYRHLIDSFQNGDLEEARRAQRISQGIVLVLKEHGGLPAGKVMMTLAGVDHGPPRLPLREVSPASIAKIEASLREIGFFDWVTPSNVASKAS